MFIEDNFSRLKKISIYMVVILCVFGSSGTAQDIGRLDSLSRAHNLKFLEGRSEAYLMADQGSWPVRGLTGRNEYFELQVVRGGFPRYYKTCNVDAARTTRTDSVQYYVGGGEGITIGQWDGGSVRGNHQELVNRAEWLDPGPYIPADHATHVAGIMIASGVDPAAEGMAYQAEVSSYEWNNDLAEMAGEAADGLLLSNHSYGTIRGWFWNGAWYWYGDTTISETEDYRFGFYDEFAASVDDMADAAPGYLVVVAASNDRNDSVEPGTEHYYYHKGLGMWQSSIKTREPDGGEDGFDCIPEGLQVTKNSLVVGAVRDVAEYNGPSDVEMTVFSSWGPTDDGRIKPDISGNGYKLYSSDAASTQSYSIHSGTSMAAPNVCGSLALLQDYYMDNHNGRAMKGATLKALAIHTAREAGPAEGPDYMYGWGLLDALEAYQLIERDISRRGDLIGEYTLNEGFPKEFFYYCDGTPGELEVTICWNDPAGEPPSPALDPPDIMLVNDLDLRVTRGAEIFRPWTLNPASPSDSAARGDNFRDNVEKVDINNPQEGVYLVRVDHKGDLEGGSENFSIVVSGPGVERTNTISVYPDGSGDAPDIKSAVAAAQDGEHIHVYPGVYYEHNITVDKKVQIMGIGSVDSTRIDAGGQGRCFIFPAGSDTIVVEGLTLTGGLSSDSGIPTAGGTGPSSPVDGCGGAVWCANPNVSLINCNFIENESDYGGAIYVSGASPDIYGSVFKSNSASLAGGGIYLDGADCLLEYCVLDRNITSGEGGGLYAIGSSPRLISCTLDRNLALIHGGGIYAGEASMVEVTQSIVYGSPAGEGIYGDVGVSGINITCSDVYGNATGDYGGGISDQTGVNGNISQDPLMCSHTGDTYGISDNSPCTPDRNSCGVLMGAEWIECHYQAVLNVAADGSGDYLTIREALDAAVGGDTILVAPGTYTGEGNWDIRFEVAEVVVISRDGPEATVIDCGAGEGSNHFGIEFSGGQDARTVLSGFTITNASKGAISCMFGSGPLIENCVITGNRGGGTLAGGGFYLYESDAVIRDCVISDNYTNEHGGAIESFRSSPLVESCVIEGNSARQNGGGIYLMKSNPVIITGTTFLGNVAVEESGGGICTNHSNVLIEDCIVRADSAGYGGGGIFNGLGSSATVINSLVLDNYAANMGGGVYSDTGMTMEGCTVTGNQAVWYGGGLELVHGDGNQLTRTVVAFNQSAGGIFTLYEDLDISCSDVYDNGGGNYTGSTADMTGVDGNFSEDPLFCNPDTGNYHVRSDSPCLPPGNPCSELAGAKALGCYDSVTAVDEDGKLPRVTRLNSVFPNPFNPVTRIRFQLSSRTAARLIVYDIAGHRVRTLVDEEMKGGEHNVLWRGMNDQGSRTASGVYFLRLSTPDRVDSRKIILLR